MVMSLTFDEALKELNPRTIWSPEMRDLIEQLRATYAPTIEMTEQQYITFKNWRFHTAGWKLSNCLEWAQDERLTATVAMQAWLHPECIKVVD